MWASPLPRDRERKLRFVELLPGGKPYLLVGARNNLGRETRVQYAPSTRLYLSDKAAGRRWVTRLPFPVHVVQRVEVLDRIRRARFVSTYAYRHGYYDGHEREFRGFGFVEQRDTEAFEHHEPDALFPDGYELVDGELRRPPVVTRSWFHTGAFLDRERISQQFAAEYWSGDPQAAQLPDSVLPEGLSPAETREALRALRGTALRVEVFAADGDPRAAHPYVVTETNMTIRRVQPRHDQAHAVFFTRPRESLACHYERGELGVDGDLVFDPRVAHALTLRVDDFGNVIRSATVAYPRRSPPTEHPEQGRTIVIVTETDVVNQAFAEDRHRLGTPMATRSFELGGIVGDDRDPLSVAALETFEAATIVPFEDEAAAGQRRLLAASEQRYYADDLSGALAAGQVGLRALPFEGRTQVVTEAQREQALAGLVDADAMAEGGYVLHADAWWSRTGRQVFDASRFFAVTGVSDPFGNATSVTYDEHTLAVTSVTDAIGNTISAQIDYRILAPWEVTDVNGSRGRARADALGMVVATAVLGRASEALGDNLDDPTTRLEYDLWAYFRTRDADTPTPVFVHAFAREQHGPENPRWAQSLTYSDGGGNVVQAKVQAEPGEAPQRDDDGNLVLAPDGSLVLAHADDRWVGTGHTILDNKGAVVKQYEPFFSDRPDYETEAVMVMQGVTPVMHYDPVGRLVRTDLPDGTLSRVEFGPWWSRAFDPNDTVLESAWWAARSELPPTDPEGRARALAEAHADTPTTSHFDSLGRPFLVEAQLEDGQIIATRSVMDVQGNVLDVIDALGKSAETRVFAMGGLALRVSSVEAGTSRALPDVLGVPLRSESARGFVVRSEFDAGRRPTHQWVRFPDGSERLVARTVYGEDAPGADDDRLRGRAWRVYDSAGLAQSDAFDFEGNPVRASRRLAREYVDTPDWSTLAGLSTAAQLDAASAALLQDESFSTEASFDALGRPITQTSPDGTVVRLAYNEASLLDRISANLRGAAEVTDFVTNIDYDAKGQRQRIDYGNGTSTAYEYDPDNFRLTRLMTSRPGTGALQDLRYTYDPAGNIVQRANAAEETLVFDGGVVQPAQQFVYDAQYRLVSATGREHASHTDQRTGPEDPLHAGTLPSDGQALRVYAETYAYDLVGNILSMAHSTAAGGWTRGYQYDYANAGNRLLATDVAGDLPGQFSAAYGYDPHGNMTAMPHLAEVTWDFADRMASAQATVGAGAGVTHFAYDASGARVRKVARISASRANERIYLGPFELYREHTGLADGNAALDVGAVELERETLHIADDAGRICLVETLTVADGEAVEEPANTHRYQYGDHLGSVMLELDVAANVISYEEFHPYGTSAYRAVDSATGVSAKRYRYAGLERDEETGLDQMGARYYASWLGRWTAADPIGLGDGVNRYAYVSGNPVGLRDPSGTSPSIEQYGDLLQKRGELIAEAGHSGASPEVLGAIEEVSAQIAEIEGMTTTATRVSTPRPQRSGGGGIVASDRADGNARTGAPMLEGALGAVGSIASSAASGLAGKFTRPGGLFAVDEDIKGLVSGTVGLIQGTAAAADRLAVAASDVDIATATGDENLLDDARRRVGSAAVQTAAGTFGIASLGKSLFDLKRVLNHAPNTGHGGGGGSKSPNAATRATRAASIGRTGQIEYGSTDLSQEAIAYAQREGVGDGTNVAVFEYLDDAGQPQTITRASQRGVGHSEQRIAQVLAEQGIPNDRVVRIYSDLEPCSAPGGYCSRMISQGSRSGLGPFPNADVTYSFPYGGEPHNPATAAAGIDALRAARRGAR